MSRRQRQLERMAAARQHMPQGVAENYRYWGEDKTVFVRQTKGCRITDCDGKEFVDFRLGYGPIILGYRDPRVDAEVQRAITEIGTLTGFSSPMDIEVIECIKGLCPQIDKVRFANSGTEAVMGAVRTARGFTGRDRVAIVEGGFHGLVDEMMWKSDVESWSGSLDQAPEIVPFGAGIPGNSRDLIDFIGLNRFDDLEGLFQSKGEDIAAVLLEPIMGNCGSIAASPEWLQALRDACDEHGALLIIDEVKTGFRVAKGGAQELYGIHGDLTTYAKAMGNGYPVACFGGRAEVMDVIGSGGGVVHGGTYTANLIGLSASLATLKILRDTDALEIAAKAGASIQAVLGSVFTKAGIAHRFTGPDAMFGVHFTEGEIPHNYRDWKQTNSPLYTAFAWKLIEHGIMLEPDSREPWFLCEAHQDVDLSWLESVASRALGEALDESRLRKA